MDKPTLEAHRSAWVIAPPFKGALPSDLTPAEAYLFQRLEREGIRLEQERVSKEWVEQGLAF